MDRYIFSMKFLHGDANISTLCCNDDEAIRTGHVVADVLWLNKTLMFSIDIQRDGGVVIATISEGSGEADFLERPTIYHSGYVKGCKPSAIGSE